MNSACAAHPARPAIATCALCGREVCDLCQRDHAGTVRCPVCSERGVPWERRAAIGTPRAYLETFRGALFDPERTFAGLAQVRSLRDAFLYDMVTHYVGATAASLIMVRTLMHPPLPSLPVLSPTAAVVTAVLLYPFTGPTGACIDLLLAALVHGALRFLGIGKDGFARTYASMCYGGSPTALNATIILPLFFIPQIWGTISTIVALRHAHATTTFRATTALVVPFGILTLLAMTAILLWVAGNMGQLGLAPPI